MNSLTPIIYMAITVLAAPIAHGTIASLTQEFLAHNKTLLKHQLQAKMFAHNHSAEMEKRPWIFKYDYGYLKNNLDGTSSTFNSQNLAKSSHFAGISKDFLWGGTFNFDNTYTRFDRSRYNSILLGEGNPVIYEFNQSLGYSQSFGKNFLGREDRAQQLSSEKLYQFNKEKLSFESEAELQKFYQNYILAQLKKTLDQLQEQAYLRAIKRKKLIKKRVQDGMREKVDLYQATYSEISQKEKVQSAKKETQESLQGLSHYLHREVLGPEITPLTYSKYSEIEGAKGQKKETDFKQNKHLLSLDKKISYHLEQVKKRKFSLAPALTLSSQYKTNHYNEEAQKSFSQGILGNDKDEIILGVHLAWPIGQKSAEISVARSKVNLKLSRLERDKVQENIVQTALSLRKKIIILEKNIVSVKQRKKISLKVLNEYTRLYQLGRAGLDQLIQSEENLIATEMSYAHYLADREQMIAGFAILNGTLRNYLLQKIR